jgi:hypothetical protein
MVKNDIDSGRQYLCARCRTQVLIGTCCDRGNRYCFGDCSKISRHEFQQKSGKLYRQTLSGKIKTNERQTRFRSRRRRLKEATPQDAPTPIPQEENEAHPQSSFSAPEKIVTHHGSPPHSPDVSILPVPTVKPITAHNPFCCHFCGQLLSEFVRTSKLIHRIRRSIPLYTRPDRRKKHHDHAP